MGGIAVWRIPPNVLTFPCGAIRGGAAIAPYRVAWSPGTPDEFAQLVEKYGDILIDGMECARVRPQDEELQKARYSGKKNPVVKDGALNNVY